MSDHGASTFDHVVDLSTKPYHPKREWLVMEHCGKGVVSIERRGDKLFVDSRKVNLFLADEQKADCISGTKLREILKERRVLNANVLDYLLEHPELIPESWKDQGGRVFFWGDDLSGTRWPYPRPLSLVVRLGVVVGLFLAWVRLVR